PPAAITAFTAAASSFLLLSCSSLSLFAFVLELPLGATPIISVWPSCAVKLTNAPFSEESGLRNSRLLDDRRLLTQLSPAALADLLAQGSPGPRRPRAGEGGVLVPRVVSAIRRRLGMDVVCRD